MRQVRTKDCGGGGKPLRGEEARRLHTGPCAANGPCGHAAIQTSQRRHAPQPDAPPTTSFPPPHAFAGAGLRGTKGGCGGVEGNRQGSPAGSLRGSAPQIGEMPGIGEVSESVMRDA
jgi:hypothetical protein